MRVALASKLLAMGLALSLALPAGAAKDGAKKDAEHVKQDVAVHRMIAQAHERAAKCLESGKPEKECQVQLAKDCQGIAIGRYCGMKHRH